MLLIAVGIGLKFGGQLGIYLVLFGLITGLNARFVSLQKIVLIAVTMTLLVVAASVWQGHIWLIIVVVGLAALFAGYTEKWSSGIGHLIPVAAVVTGTVSHNNAPIEVGLWALFGCAVGIIIMTILKIKQKPVIATNLQIKINTLALICLGMIYTYIIIKYDLPRGYWAVFTLCAVLKPGIGETLKVIRERVAGTIIGALAGMVAVTYLPQPFITVGVILSMLGMIYYMLVGKYTNYVIFLTLLIVLALAKGSGAEAVHIGDLRAALTVGSALITGVVAIALWYLEKRINIAKTRKIAS